MRVSFLDESSNKYIPSLRPFKGSTENLTGLVKGRLEVVGISSELPQGWVCECLCGNYCFRKAKALKNPDNLNDSCKGCKDK